MACPQSVFYNSSQLILPQLLLPNTSIITIPSNALSYPLALKPVQCLQYHCKNYHQTSFILTLTPNYHSNLNPLYYGISSHSSLPFAVIIIKSPTKQFSHFHQYHHNNHYISLPFLQSSFSITTPQSTSKCHNNNTSISNHFLNTPCQIFDNEVVLSATRDIYLKNSSKGFMQTSLLNDFAMLSVLGCDAAFYGKKGIHTPFFTIPSLQATSVY